MLVNGDRLTGPHQDASVVFQEHGLFPWMSVRKNIGFNLKARGVSAAERAEGSPDQLIEVVGLRGFEDSIRTSSRVACASASASRVR